MSDTRSASLRCEPLRPTGRLAPPLGQLPAPPPRFPKQAREWLSPIISPSTSTVLAAES